MCVPGFFMAAFYLNTFIHGLLTESESADAVVGVMSGSIQT